MTELSFIIAPPFTRGLRPEENYRNEEGFLEECFLLIPDEGGLKVYDGPVDPFQGGLNVVFPLPQAFLGRDIALLAGTTSISEVNTSVSPWTLTAIDTKDPDDSGVNKSITTGGVWHFADLGEAWYLTNGACTIFRTGLEKLSGSTAELTFVQDDVTIGTICEHRGRVYIGGLDGDDIWTNLLSVIAGWTSSAELDNLSLHLNGPDANWVLWSSIGGGDFPLWLFQPSAYSNLGLGPDSETIQTRLRRNEFGWVAVPWTGTVKVLKPLGTDVIVYGDNGITALRPRQGLVGIQGVAEFGIGGRGGVGGDDKGHIFLSANGTLWSLSEGLNLERLGFEEYLSHLPAESTVITLREEPREFYISSSDEAYVLVDQGLAETPDRLTSITYLRGTFFAVHTSSGSTDVRVLTASFDMRRQAYKTLHDLQVLYSDIEGLEVSVLYRYNHTDSFQTWGPVAVNPQGVVTPMLTALEFKIQITGTPGAFPRLDGIEVRWNLVDNRAVRGVFPEGQQATLR